MDSLIAAAARALATGDPFGALNRVALREDAPGLALRGIAMAQLGDLARAKGLLRRAARAFGAREAAARARCVVAEAEIALVSRDLTWPTRTLAAARDTLEAHGDRINAAHARTLEVRRQLLIGRLDEAERILDGIDIESLPPASRAACGLAAAGIAMRRLRTAAARAALARAEDAARAAAIPALRAEVEAAGRALDRPVARLVGRDGADQPLRLDAVEVLFASDTLVVDACRHAVRWAGSTCPLASRPVLFALVRVLGETWPKDAPRALLLARAFGARQVDASHRARLRVEIGRLRAALRPLADVEATARGFALVPRGHCPVAVLAPPVEGPHGALLALVADGEAWSSAALALALGASARTVQRALGSLAAEGSVRAFGQGRGRRWMLAVLPGLPTTLLLPGPLPGS